MKKRASKLGVSFVIAFAAQRFIALYLAGADPIARATSGHLPEVGGLVLALLVLRFYLVIVLPAQAVALAVEWFAGRRRESRPSTVTSE